MQDNIYCVTSVCSEESIKFYESLGFQIGKHCLKPFPYWLMSRTPRSFMTSCSQISMIDRIEGVEVKEILGEGKFGQVFLGIWEGTEVALKKLKGRESLSDFNQEAAILLYF